MMNEATNDGEAKWLKFGDIQLFARETRAESQQGPTRSTRMKTRFVRSPISCRKLAMESFANECPAPGESIIAFGRSGPRLAILPRSRFTPHRGYTREIQADPRKRRRTDVRPDF